MSFVREYFNEFKDSYILIGGAACFLVMDEEGASFRATKDLDIELCIEATDVCFVERFWEFIKTGGYNNKEKSATSKNF